MAVPPLNETLLVEIAELGLQGWAGLTWQQVELIGETPKKFRIRAIQRTKLGGRCRWIDPGETTLVPKHAIRRSVERDTTEKDTPPET